MFKLVGKWNANPIDVVENDNANIAAEQITLAMTEETGAITQGLIDWNLLELVEVQDEQGNMIHSSDAGHRHELPNPVSQFIVEFKPIISDELIEKIAKEIDQARKSELGGDCIAKALVKHIARDDTWSISAEKRYLSLRKVP